MIEGSFAPLTGKLKTKLPPVTPTRLVKARKDFQQKLREISSSTHFSSEFTNSHEMHLCVCFALFEYLTLGIDQGCAAFDYILKKFEANSLDHEQLMIAYVQLLSYHQATHKAPPSLLRNLLYKAMDIYPDNTLFLTLFVKGEGRVSIANRLRRYFDDACAKHPSAILYMFSIETEMSRLGSGYRIKSLFEKALEHPLTRNSPILWRTYISWQVEQAGDPRAAKQVFYRAIRHLPWAKTVWLDSMRVDLRHMFTQGELHDLYTLLNEKEVRVRCELQLPTIKK